MASWTVVACELQWNKDFFGQKKKKDIFFQIKTEFNIKLHPYSNYIIVLCLHILKEFILF